MVGGGAIELIDASIHGACDVCVRAHTVSERPGGSEPQQQHEADERC